MDKDIIQLYIINNIDLCTLVTAGVYLLLRCSPILEYSPTALLVITIVGASTAFFAATCGLVANDLKRIIAMSTISQLGYPWFLGRNVWNARDHLVITELRNHSWSSLAMPLTLPRHGRYHG